MRQDKQAANYCKLCGRELKGTERLTGICLRCKSIGNREGAQDVQDAFEKALSGYFVERGHFSASGGGWTALVITAVLFAVFFFLFAVTRDLSFSFRFTAAAGFPLEIVAAVLAFAAFFRPRAHAVAPFIALAVNVCILIWLAFAARAAWMELAGGLKPPLSKLREVVTRLLS